MNKILLAVIAAFVMVGNFQGFAQSSPLIVDQLSFEPVHDVAERSIIARDKQNRPSVVILRLSQGDVLPPHGALANTRLITVLEGELSWGEGEQITPADEVVYSPGSVIIVPKSELPHWAAARSTNTLLMVTVLHEANLSIGASPDTRP